MKGYIKVFIVAFGAGILGSFTFHYFSRQVLEQEAIPVKQLMYDDQIQLPIQQVSSARMAMEGIDFVEASAKSTPSVVFIKSTSAFDYGRKSWIDLFFEGGNMQSASSGSGVIYSADGYIITNNHVIENATEIEVIHEKKSYKAQVIGTDPSSDIAVLKIEANALPKVTISTSRVQVGEWVLAVGNPFNLTSTVTAGIVSAKGREINIMKSKFPIESFIQTDAAINPGNSGGALVNIRGELVGINTAILSQTGSYTGYGFAVPVDVVTKVVNDIIKHGIVQKAFIGADVMDLNSEVAAQLSVKELSGVAVSYLQRDGAAEKAGIQKGDIILSIDNENMESRSSFEEKLSYHSPGDNVKVVYKRGDKAFEATLTLTNSEGNTALTKREIYSSPSLGADFESVPKVERDLLRIDSGVRIAKVKNGFIFKLGIQEGFIVTSVNKASITSPQQLAKMLEEVRGRVIIEGVSKTGERGYYSFYF